MILSSLRPEISRCPRVSSAFLRASSSWAGVYMEQQSARAMLSRERRMRFLAGKRMGDSIAREVGDVYAGESYKNRRPSAKVDFRVARNSGIMGFSGSRWRDIKVVRRKCGYGFGWRSLASLDSTARGGLLYGIRADGPASGFYMGYFV